MYDVIIIGGGPAGLTSALYLLRADKNVLILEKENIGGQITSSSKVANYPGFGEISGMELMNNLYNQVVNLGGEVVLEEALEIDDDNTVITDCGKYKAKAIILAVGSKNKVLGIEREDEFVGRGISFCVSCDGAFYQGKTVAVVGGGNSAISEALSLADICSKVYIIQKDDNIAYAQTTDYTDSDIQLMARAINGEARGDSYEGQVAVGAVILNRVKSSEFPNTISGVIYQPGAFTAVSDGQINEPISEDSTVYKAARDALNGWDPTNGCLYYFNPNTATSSWIWSREIVKTIGKHNFCK